MSLRNAFSDTKPLHILYIFCSVATCFSTGAIAPPAWANPKYNPCALQGRGWQMLYWPPDGQCYKIFQMGYPCPPDMELSPTTTITDTGEKQITADCRCPPGTAQFVQNETCYTLFTIGPCKIGQYFAPQQSKNINTKGKWGICKQIEQCRNLNEIPWPPNGQCYIYLTRGPCPKGQLLTVGSDQVATCTCNHRYEMRNYWSTGNGCFEHYTKGPCHENGQLFLPNRTCGCHQLLPHYHNKTERCYEIGTIGPCNSGEHFQLDVNNNTGSCQCKKGHIRYENGKCYRPYTQGPCEFGHMLLNTTTCILQPCGKGHLYYPPNNKCYRIGSKGPCNDSYIITFDFETRPSIDGVSHNGICGCKQNAYNHECIAKEMPTSCTDDKFVKFNNQCFKLYSQEPCQQGAWLTIKRVPKGQNSKEGICECMPSYIQNVDNATICSSSTTGILRPFQALVQFHQ